MKLQNVDAIKKNITVDISDAKVSADPARVLATYSLGSCVGVCLYSRLKQVGGMLHYLLPDSKENPQRAKENPFMYADTGMKCLLKKLASMGVEKHQIKIKIAGGAERLKTVSKAFNIGKRNYLAIRKILWKIGMFIDSEDVGGVSPRTLYMNIADGSVIIRTKGIERNL
jgi:chemotaxis protein CheD